MLQWLQPARSAIVCVCLLGVFTLAPLFSDTVTVNVLCSNGRSVPNLVINVVDSLGQQVVGASQTDADGNFAIVDTQLYTAPFSMSFTTTNGSTCGRYPVNIDSGSTGVISLNYYPTQLPCSCSHFLD